MSIRLFLFSTLLLYVSGVFAETNFTFAPPPITAVAKAGETKKRIVGTYMQIDIPGDNVTGLGLNYISRTGRSSGATSSTFGAMGLSNESGSLSGGTVNGSLNLEYYVGKDPSFILFAGVPLALSAISIDTAFDTNTITTITAGIQGGVQKHFTASPGVVIVPYLIFSKQYASSEDDNGNSNTFDITTTTIGMDIIIQNISLGAMANSGADDDLLLIQLGYNF